MKPKSILNTKIGIIGGGQLGKMMILEAKRMGFYVVILDPTPNCPAHSLSDEHLVASFEDEEAIRLLAKKTDVVTYEFEHIHAKILTVLEAQGKKIYPTAKSLTVIQNKYTQKKVLRDGDVPVPDFMEANTVVEFQLAAERFGYPFMMKSCTGGYDGKGNYVVKRPEDIPSGVDALGSGRWPLMAERLVRFEKEVSVIACRGIDGETVVYPVGENIHRDNILHKTIVPARIPDMLAQKAMELAGRVMEIFEGVGIFCVELFVTGDGQVLVNEVAPRPHNSGHYTIEACHTCQFEQHVRAVTGLPLGKIAFSESAVMVNLLGSAGHAGKACYEGIWEAAAIPGVKLHIYGKEYTQPKRKMGHITATDSNIETAEQNAEEAASLVRVAAEQVNDEPEGDRHEHN